MCKDMWYKLIRKCSNSDEEVSVYWSEDEAHNAMIIDLDTEISKLRNMGHEPNVARGIKISELFVPNDTYIKWEIVEGTMFDVVAVTPTYKERRLIAMQLLGCIKAHIHSYGWESEAGSIKAAFTTMCIVNGMDNSSITADKV